MCDRTQDGSLAFRTGSAVSQSDSFSLESWSLASRVWLLHSMLTPAAGPAGDWEGIGVDLLSWEAFIRKTPRGSHPALSECLLRPRGVVRRWGGRGGAGMGCLLSAWPVLRTSYAVAQPFTIKPHHKSRRSGKSKILASVDSRTFFTFIDSLHALNFKGEFVVSKQKIFMNVSSFNFHNDPVRWILLS